MLTELISKDSLEDIKSEFKSFHIELLPMYNGYTLKETITNNNGVSMNKIIGNISKIDDKRYILKIDEEPHYDPKYIFERVMNTYSLGQIF